jgi:Uma2 family endonuclease
MAITSKPANATLTPTVSWDLLPKDYPLPDDPVDNINQPLLAAALRESLEMAGLIQPEMLIATNFGICATVDGKTVVKAPDWVFVQNAQSPPENQTRRSYTPVVEGDLPALVAEFISETEGGEYSMNPNYPYGKWWFYERILQVPLYFIFYPDTGALEGYHLVSTKYEEYGSNNQGRFWVAALNLFLGVWQGTKVDRTGYWLRWWDSEGNLLPWGVESLDRERQRAEEERQRAEEERRRAERLAERLRELGVDPETLE